MKTINALAMLSLLIIVSCKPNLDIEPSGAPHDILSSQEGAVKTANAMYVNFDHEDFYGGGLMYYNNASDDMVTGRPDGDAETIRTFGLGTSTKDYQQQQWKFRYTNIGRANALLRGVPKISFSDQKLKNKILGEAWFISALMYYELAYNYGTEKAGVPLIDPFAEATGKPIPRTPNVKQNYDSIISWFNKASDLLPYFNELATVDQGRPHKTAAWAFLSKTYLLMKDYANAEKYASMVIKSGKHDLLKNYADVFKIANNWSSEYIWSCVSTVQGGSITPGQMLENKGWGIYNGWGYYTPTKELYDAFQSGDTRCEATILKPGDKFVFFGIERSYESTNSQSGYQFNKYMEPFSYADAIGKTVNPNGNHPTTALNVPIMRYAEVILIKAEALLGQGKNADTEINMIRQRARLLPLSGASMTDLKRERRCELAGEFSNRHLDLVRWGDAQSTYARPLHGVNGKVISEGRSFNPAVHRVWPVPSSEITNSGGVITQNEGW